MAVVKINKADTDFSTCLIYFYQFLNGFADKLEL